MRTRSGLAVFAVFVVGCGGGGKQEAKPISGPAKDVADVVAQLQRATAQKDYATICEQLLAAATRREAGGSQCEAVLAARARGVAKPRIRIRNIEVQGDSATVRVTTTARGQAAVDDVIRLVREGGRYRVSSLGR